MELELTIRVKDGRPSITGPLNDRETCLKLLAVGFRMVLQMKPQDVRPADPAVPDRKRRGRNAILKVGGP